MGLFRRLRKLIDSQIPGEEDLRQIPNDRQPRRRPPPPPAQPSNGNYDAIPQSFFTAVDSARQQAGYDPLPVFVRGEFQTEEDRLNQELEAEFAAMDRQRAKSLERSSRHGSAKNLNQLPPGTPIKFRRRQPSSGLLQQSASMPFFFQQQSLPSSPEMLRRFQQQQHFQQMARQQRDMMMAQPHQFHPQFQQQFHPMMNPNVNMQGWFMMQQPRMYPFY